MIDRTRRRFLVTGVLAGGLGNAPVDDADVPDIVDYLAKTYGTERERP